MRALPGILSLLVFIYVRPQEFMPDTFGTLPFLYVFLAMAIAGLLFDLNTRQIVVMKSTQQTAVFIFYGWVMFTIFWTDATNLTTNGITISVSVTLYLICLHGIQTVASFVRVTLTIFALGFFVAGVGTHQGLQPFQCIGSDPFNRLAKLAADGRPCSHKLDGLPADGHSQCVEGGMPGRRYACEKVGILGTTSIGAGRVRYLGVLEDPNELGLATSMCLPFAFAFSEQRKSLFRKVLLLVTLSIVGLTNLFTASRGGQVVFSAVLGAYFMKRYGLRKGLVAAAVFTVPLVVLGGREGAEADESAQERLLCAAEGIKMALNHPIVGVGYAKFTEYHFLTAHNAYILALGELGFTGMVMFVMLLYLSLKIPWVVMNSDLQGEDAEVAKSMAMSMLATFVGASVGVFFLSWTYHYVLWIHFGLSGALLTMVKRRDRTFDVRISVQEVFGVATFCLMMIGALYLRARQKGAW